MEPSKDCLIYQYHLVKECRKVLLDYCKTVSPEDFINQNTTFGRGGSMRNLLVHIVNTYQFWIVNNSLMQNIIYTKYEEIISVDEITELFHTIDKSMEEFMKLNFKDPIEFEMNSVKSIVKPLKLFSHVITHEFHHKGQILSLSRHLGYVPVDTDIMR